MQNTLLISIELAFINERIRNEIMAVVIQSRRRYLLENQILKIDLKTLDLINPTLKKIID
jgi:hypothetical protein